MPYEIRFCQRDEGQKLIRFIRDSVRRDHIFVKNPRLLDWQHLEVSRYNFVVASDTRTGQFHGILGFSSPRFYSTGKVSIGDDLWPMLWSVDQALSDDRTLGAKLLLGLKAMLRPASVTALGITKQLATLYERMGYRVGEMAHYYLLNKSYPTFAIASLSSLTVQKNFAGSRDSNGFATAQTLRELKPAELDRESWALPSNPLAKDFGYVRGRFANHPVYKYRFWAVEDSESRALIVARKITVGDSACIRIVDFFGLEAVSPEIYGQFQRLLASEGAEYIDLLVTGVNKRQIEQMGFVESTDDNFVPHLFEPFEPRRSTVLFSIFDDKDLPIFKGDSDLDRPSKTGRTDYQ